jgi:histidinol dehydrogenase
MEILELKSISNDRLRHLLQRANARIFASDVVSTAQRAIEDVRARGDAALLEYTRLWDQVTLTADQLVARPEDFEHAHSAISNDLRQALIAAIARARRFNERLKPATWLEQVEEGITVGTQVTPVAGVGVYVPSGRGGSHRLA